MVSIDETYSLTGYEPNAYDFKETYVESYTELLTSSPFFSKQGFPEDAEYDDAALEDMLREAQRVHEKTCLSVSRGRLCRKERSDMLEKERDDLLSQVVRMHRLEFCWTDKKSEFLPSATQKLTETNFKLKNFNDEINSFFMDSY